MSDRDLLDKWNRRHAEAQGVGAPMEVLVDNVHLLEAVDLDAEFAQHNARVADGGEHAERAAAADAEHLAAQAASSSSRTRSRVASSSKRP